MPPHTAEYGSYLGNFDKLQQFIEFSKSLDPDAEAIRLYRSSYFNEIKNAVVERATAKVTAEQPHLVSDPVQFAAAVSDVQNEIESDVWQERLQRYHTLRNELTVVQLVTIIEVYISEILRLLFNTNNSLLLNVITDDHFMRYKELLKYNSISEIKGEIIERTVQQIMKRSILRMIKFIQECCPKYFSYDETEGAQFERFWDTRNLIIHQNSIIDDAYSKKYSETQGAFLQIDEAFIQSHTAVLQQVLGRLDTAVQTVATQK